MKLLTDDPLRTIRLHAASYVLDLAYSSDLPAVADRALQGKLYTSALAELADTSQPIMSTVGPLFECALDELGERLPSRTEAAWMLTRHCMQLLTETNGPPEDVLRFLVWRVLRAVEDEFPKGRFVGEGLGISPLVGLFYSYDAPNENYYEAEGRFIESETERRAILDRLAREEAAEWLKSHPA